MPRCGASLPPLAPRLGVAGIDAPFRRLRPRFTSEDVLAAPEAADASVSARGQLVPTIPEHHPRRSHLASSADRTTTRALEQALATNCHDRETPSAHQSPGPSSRQACATSSHAAKKLRQLRRTLILQGDYFGIVQPIGGDFVASACLAVRRFVDRSAVLSSVITSLQMAPVVTAEHDASARLPGAEPSLHLHAARGGRPQRMRGCCRQS